MVVQRGLDLVLRRGELPPLEAWPVASLAVLCPVPGPAALVPVHVGVGPVEDVIDGVTGLHDRPADRAAHRDLPVVVELDGASQCVPAVLGHRLGVPVAARVVQDDRELVTGQPADHVGRAGGPIQATGDLPEI